MKKITIMVGIFALFIHTQPVLAWDNWGQADDPVGEVYDWGATCEICWDELVIEGQGPGSNWPDWPDWPHSDWGDPDDWNNDISSGGGGAGGGPLGGNNGNDDGGSGNGGNGGKPVPAMHNSLPNQAQAALGQVFRAMVDQYCMYYEMNSYLESLGAQFSDVVLDAESSAGGYDACHDKLTFQSEDLISQAFPEEYIHFFQDHIYPGGICVYLNSNNPRKNNIEFEAKFVQDLANYIAAAQGYRDGGLMHYGAGLNLGAKYGAWINHLTNNGTTMPSPSKIAELYQSYNYLDFMSDWASYNGVSIDPYFNSIIFSGFSMCW
ncbi:MAG: hypothetical protein LBH19_13865 [Dysgonamonadaceae bacterium]|nr:hypothetical protein [Dysgonamonadaceae bacterium]